MTEREPATGSSYPPFRQYPVEVKRDIVYGMGRIHVSDPARSVERPLALDLYEPSGTGSAHRPALLLAFGGAFHRGSKEDDVVPEGDKGRNTAIADYCRALARRGYVACSIDYRLIPEDPDPGDTMVITDPEGIPRSRVDDVRAIMGLPPATTRILHNGLEAACDDMAKAFRFIKARANAYGIDPARIAVGGWSAGARTALCAAYGERVGAAAVVSLSGFMATTDLQRHVTGAPGEPPVLLAYADRDLEYVRGQNPEMARHFAAVGIPRQVVRIPDGTHFYPSDNPVIDDEGGQDTVLGAVEAFLARTIGHP